MGDWKSGAGSFRARALAAAGRGLFLSLGIALLTAGPLQALAPAKINYQGKLTDANGNPRSGPVQMFFRVYTNGNPTPGSHLYQSPTYTVSVANGVFNAKIDVPAAHFQGAGADSRWLEVVVENAALRPLHELQSAPYAMAVAAGSVTDAEIAVGAGIALSKLSAGGTFPNGTYVFPGQITLPGNSVFTAAGRLGIGNQNPQAPLDITSNVSGFWGGWVEAIRLSQPANSAIHHPGSGLFLAMNSNRFFYFGNAIDQIYPMTLSHLGDMTLNGGLNLPNGSINAGGGLAVGGAVTAATGRFDGGLFMNAANVGVTQVIDAGGTWHRSYGQSGWVNNTYGGGWWMADTTYMRVYGSKTILAPSYMDEDNGNYFVDPAAKSVFNTVQIAGNNPAPGRMLTSLDGNGNAAWTPVPDSVPAGAVMFFTGAYPTASGCPAGWGPFSLADGRVLVGGPSNDIGWNYPIPNLSPRGGRVISEVPTHTHSIPGYTATTRFNEGGHSHTVGPPLLQKSNAGSGSNDKIRTNDGTSGTIINMGTTSGGEHQHNVDIPASNTGNNPGGVPSVDVTMPYVQLLACYKL